MPGSTRTIALCAVVALVLVTAYTVALRADGWLWFGWSVLALLAAGSLLLDRGGPGRRRRR